MKVDVQITVVTRRHAGGAVEASYNQWLTMSEYK